MTGREGTYQAVALAGDLVDDTEGTLAYELALGVGVEVGERLERNGWWS